jgi:hypothetical protein
VYIKVGLKNISLVSTSYLAKSETADAFKVKFFSVLSMKVYSGSGIASSNGTLASSSGRGAGGLSSTTSSLPFFATFLSTFFAPFYLEAAIKASSSLLLCSSSSLFF